MLMWSQNWVFDPFCIVHMSRLQNLFRDKYVNSTNQTFNWNRQQFAHVDVRFLFFSLVYCIDLFAEFLIITEQFCIHFRFYRLFSYHFGPSMQWMAYDFHRLTDFWIIHSNFAPNTVFFMWQLSFSTCSRAFFSSMSSKQP